MGLEQTALVNEAVEGGDYAPGSEVIRETLREWKQLRSALQYECDHLRGLLAEGLASGPGRFENISAIKAEAHRRWLDEQPKHGR